VKDFFVRDAVGQEGTTITSFFVVSGKQVRARRTGGNYVHFTFGDKTGTLTGKLWDGVEAADGLGVNDFVKVRGRIGSYQGQQEITVEKIRRAELNEVQLEDYLATTAHDVQVMWAELMLHITSLDNLEVKSVLKAVVGDEQIAGLIRRAPAAKLFHHAFLGGLLEHITSLCRLVEGVQQNYPWIDHDLLIAGVVLHDIGKIYELAYERAFTYTDEGRLRGHISIGVQLLHEAAAKAGISPQLEAVLEHLILSHHGELEHGSPVEPALPEAYLLHFLDNIDARMAAMYAALQEPTGEEVWSRPVPALRKPVLRLSEYLRR